MYIFFYCNIPTNCFNIEIYNVRVVEEYIIRCPEIKILKRMYLFVFKPMTMKKNCRLL